MHSLAPKSTSYVSTGGGGGENSKEVRAGEGGGGALSASEGVRSVRPTHAAFCVLTSGAAGCFVAACATVRTESMGESLSAW